MVHEPVRGRLFALAAVLLACGALALVAAPSAEALVTDVNVNGHIEVRGSSEDDVIAARLKVDGKGNLILQIRDPDGVLDAPPPCERVDEQTIVCPGELALFLVFAGLAGPDDFIFDLPPLIVEPSSSFVTPLATAPRVTATGGSGNDEIHSFGLSIDNHIGGKGDDELSGDVGNDNLNGGGGDDKLKGGAGNDRLVCGGGEDKGVGAGGKDTAKGCEKGKP